MMVTPINDLQSWEPGSMVKGERLMRCKLASVHRLFDLYGWAQISRTCLTVSSNNFSHYIPDLDCFPNGLLFLFSYSIYCNCPNKVRTRTSDLIVTLHFDSLVRISAAQRVACEDIKNSRLQNATDCIWNTMLCDKLNIFSHKEINNYNLFLDEVLLAVRDQEVPFGSSRTHTTSRRLDRVL